MTVDGGTWNATGSILVGGEGTGSLTVTGGGQVNTKSVAVAQKNGVTGTLTVSGSSTLKADTLFLGEGGGTATLNLQTGSLLDISDTIHLGTNSLLVSTGGTLRTERLTGDGRITAVSSGGVPLTIDQSGNSTFGGSIRIQSANFATDFTKAGAGGVDARRALRHQRRDPGQRGNVAPEQQRSDRHDEQLLEQRGGGRRTADS
jgi:autotransporter family porin